MARRATESFNLSFLDIMSCGFGAMVLLLIITKTSAPVPLEDSETPKEGSVKELQQQVFEIRGETTILNRDLNAKHEQLSRYNEMIARLKQQLTQMQGNYDTLTLQTEEDDSERGQLVLARQALTDEMRRLQEQLSEQVKTDSVGGVPVDSE
jgi:septal ring factor EnvC (AmiA/AmiB activator)